MPFRWNWTLSAIQQCQTFLSWRNLPAAEQREKMVSPLLCIFLTRLHTSWIEHFAFIIGWMRNVQTKVSKRAVSGHIEREASLLLCPTSLAKANAGCLIMSVVLEICFPFFCARLCQDQIEQPRSSGPLYAQHVCGGGLHNVPDSIEIMELDRFYLWHNTLRFTTLTR